MDNLKIQERTQTARETDPITSPYASNKSLVRTVQNIRAKVRTVASLENIVTQS